MGHSTQLVQMIKSLTGPSGTTLTGPSGTRKKAQWGGEDRQQGGACAEVGWGQVTQSSVRQGLIHKFRVLIQGPS